MERNLECCECGKTFVCEGCGDFTTCPYCGAELQIGGFDKNYDRRDTDSETDYYDSDMEGAPGYYGGW